jgi:putative PIN family toxin of toxin-antitoxin system
MTKVVLDANIFVSAIIVPKGNSAQIFELAKRDKIKLIISQPILEEVRRVLFYPHIQKRHKSSPEIVERKLKKMIQFALFLKPKLKINAVKDDPDDNKYLECAVEGKADYIISGDKHLKKLKEFQGIKIVEPATFLKLIAK